MQRKVGPARTPGERDGMTKAEAEKEFALMREREGAVVAAAHRATMQEAGDALNRALEIRGRKKSHRLTVAADLRNHIVPFFEGNDLAKIKPEDVERYIAVKTRTLAVKTIRNHLNTMHSVFEIGLRRRWCVSNPVKLAERPVIRTNETRIQFLDQEELERLLSTSFPEDAFASIEPALYLTAAMTGLRQGGADRPSLARCRSRGPPSPRGLPIRPRRVRRPEVRALRSLGAAGRAGGQRACCASRALRLRKRLKPGVLPSRVGSSARPLEAHPTLQTGNRSRRGHRDHLPRVAPYLRHEDGGSRRAAAHLAALDGPRRCEDNPGLRPLPALRRRGRDGGACVFAGGVSPLKRKTTQAERPGPTSDSFGLVHRPHRPSSTSRRGCEPPIIFHPSMMVGRAVPADLTANKRSRRRLSREPRRGAPKGQAKGPTLTGAVCGATALPRTAPSCLPVGWSLETRFQRLPRNPCRGNLDAQNRIWRVAIPILTDEKPNWRAVYALSICLIIART